MNITKIIIKNLYGYLNKEIEFNEDINLLVGINGSGKTSLEKLILGLYAPDEGSILIDGIDIKQIDPADLEIFS